MFYKKNNIPNSVNGQSTFERSLISYFGQRPKGSGTLFGIDRCYGCSIFSDLEET
jgi:hypothetical protein